ncbi:SLAP domain-containing protein [Clostridium massiliamazoniense]|uniref:SLAP domain-containing protein n=1 Tax=Clostridium massiliamazoniense TaxID=1347366 RepID=UPI0006D77820|nr:SLAP domain-containing protein [Clostridium massiliamazoniense]
MNNGNLINISLQEKSDRSSYLNNLLFEELKEIILTEELYEGALSLVTKYIYVNNYFIEFGIFIINNSEKEIYIEKIPLSIMEDARKLVDYNLVIKENFKPKKAHFHELKIPLEILNKVVEEKSLKLTLGNLRNLKYEEVYNLEIVDLDKVESKSIARKLKKFVKSTTGIERNYLTINKHSISKDKAGNVNVVLLFRNSSDKDLKLKTLPINIYTENNLLCYRQVCSLGDDFLIPKNKGSFYIMEISKEEFPVEAVSNLENCRIDFIR